MSKYILGIDLGSTNSAFSIMEGGEAKIITNAEGARTTPSVVAITSSGERLVGVTAKRQAVTNPKNTIYTIKRLIGRKYKEVEDYVKLLPYEVKEAANGDCRVVINGKEYSPEEISSFILSKIKADAEAYLGEKITDAVITVPAYFNNNQRASTKDAGEIAGLNVKRIINEPTASSLAYSKGKALNKVIAVYDFGGSTFDISILDVSDGVVEVLATNGDVNLGGDDIDNALMTYVINQFEKDTGISLLEDKIAIQRIKDEVEKCKITLSTTPTYDINLPFITMDQNGPKHLITTMTRALLEEIARPIVSRSIEPCKKCLADSGKSSVDEVLMVGGMTRMPLIYETAKSIFGVDPNRNINPDEAVSLGAAVQGSILAGETNDILLLDVTPLSLGINTMYDQVKVMVERNTTIPCKKTEIFSNAVDMQPKASIQICQGERPSFYDNKLLGQFDIELVPAPKGVAKIEVEFNIDANGILIVTAKDMATGKSQNIKIEGSSGLSEEEIESAKKSAEEHADEDKKKIELNNERNKSDAMCYSLEKLIKDDTENKLTEDEKKTITTEIENLRKVVSGNDIDAIKTAFNRMMDVVQPITSKLYQGMNDTQSNANNSPFGNGPFGNGNPFTDSTMFNNNHNQQNKHNNDDVIDVEDVSEK